MVPDPRNTAHIIEVISKEKITLYPGVPAMYIGLINHPKAKEFDLHSVKACLSGGSALPVEVAQKFEALTGGKLVEGFGMTECSPRGHGQPDLWRGARRLDRPAHLQHDRRHLRAGAGRGRQLPHAARRARRAKLILRGPQVMKGYWQMPDETAKTIDSEGWLHTGDIAKMDADGYFYIVDRKKDIIIASGFNIVPREVEEVLFKHPKVLEAAVAGIPDPKRGETVKAYVVLKPRRDEQRGRAAGLLQGAAWRRTRCRRGGVSQGTAAHAGGQGAAPPACAGGEGKAGQAGAGWLNWAAGATGEQEEAAARSIPRRRLSCSPQLQMQLLLGSRRALVDLLAQLRLFGHQLLDLLFDAADLLARRARLQARSLQLVIELAQPGAHCLLAGDQ